MNTGIQRNCIVVVMLALPALVLPSCGKEPAQETEEHLTDVVELPVEAQENIGLVVTEARHSDLVRTMKTTGIVSVDQTRYAHIRPLARAIVEKVHVKLGARVRRGDPLISYDNIKLGELAGDYVRVSGELERARAEEDVAGKILDRARSLLEVEAVSRQEYEVREAEYRQAVAATKSSRAELVRVEEKLHRFGWRHEDIQKLLKEAESANTLHRSSSHNVLRAPFDGIVVDYDVAPGELVDRDQRLFTLADTSTVWVLVDVYEKDIGRTRTGAECRVRVPSYAGEVFSGEVTYISDFLDPASRTAKVRCVVPNEDGRLKLEMFAEVEIPAVVRRDVLAIPVSALQQVEGGLVVFVRKDATRFEKRLIQIGDRGDDWLEVRRGLREGDSVVSDGSFYLKSIVLREQIGEEH